MAFASFHFPQISNLPPLSSVGITSYFPGEKKSYFTRISSSPLNFTANPIEGKQTSTAPAHLQNSHILKLQPFFHLGVLSIPSNNTTRALSPR
jgi:hypothetical protein